ncbi:trypsin-like peptidase domain-containing protein [Streptomyces sp. NPDC001617]
MNQGKPTKPKWWSRGGRQDHGDLGEGTVGSPKTPDPVSGRAPAEAVSGPGPGDAVGGPMASEAAGGVVSPDEVQGSARAASAVEAFPLRGGVDGDFELPRPMPDDDAAPAVPDGDFELQRPQGLSGPRASEDARAEGDFELEPPAETLVLRPDAASASALTASRKPLHDPDPYSTPPYGEPGPWAPAPPVQHPAATPAQGTSVPTQPAPHGTPAPTGPVPHADAPGPTGLTPQGAPTPASATPESVPPDTPFPAPRPPSLSTPWQNYDPWSSPPTPPPAPLQQTGAAVAATDHPRRRARGALLGGAVVLALVSGSVGGVIGAYLERNGGVGAVELPQAGKEAAGRAPDSVAGIAARALPSVVTLHVSGADESGTGTGFVLDDLGHILTNNHVVESAGDGGTISVTFNSGDTAKATVVGRDSGYDLAVVKVSGVRGLKPMALGNSDNVQVGDPVVAIGAPFDLAGTVTSGIISAKERPITAGGDSPDGSDVSYVDALQTDAPINPGNSGGPLLDSQARVIGINSAIRSADDGSDSGSGQAGSIGLGFAIPVNQAKRVAEELINTGKATHPVIGVTLDMGYPGDGARVGRKASGGGPAVTAGGPGDKAGIKAGDIITEVDGRRVHSGEELIVKTRAHRPGDRLELTVERGGKERRISLVLGSSDGG